MKHKNKKIGVLAALAAKPDFKGKNEFLTQSPFSPAPTGCGRDEKWRRKFFLHLKRLIFCFYFRGGGVPPPPLSAKPTYKNRN